MKFKLDENLPVSSAAILTGAGHDVDTVTQEGLIGAPGQDVVAAATAAGRILISLDRGPAYSVTYSTALACEGVRISRRRGGFQPPAPRIESSLISRDPD